MQHCYLQNFFSTINSRNTFKGRSLAVLSKTAKRCLQGDISSSISMRKKSSTDGCLLAPSADCSSGHLCFRKEAHPQPASRAEDSWVWRVSAAQGAVMFVWRYHRSARNKSVQMLLRSEPGAGSWCTEPALPNTALKPCWWMYLGQEHVTDISQCTWDPFLFSLCYQASEE